jgi:vacuolar-type H+-ATPase subunit I/STV1
MNMEQLKEFVCLENRKRDLDAEMKGVKAKLDELEEALVPQFIEDGVQSMKVDGRTVSLAQEIYASPLDGRERVVEALKASELAQYVSENYNTNSLSAFVREVARDVAAQAEREERIFTEEDVRAALPAPLGQALKISFVHTLRSRKA